MRAKPGVPYQILRDYRFELPFHARLRVGFSLIQHTYAANPDSRMSDHRYVLQPHIVFDPPVFRKKGWPNEALR